MVNIRLICNYIVTVIKMADEHDETETQNMLRKEVAKALEAVLPTYMEDMQSSLREFLQQEFLNLKTVEDVERPPKRVTYKEFVACKPMEFDGVVDPLRSQRWLAEMESTFETSGCDPADEVMFAGNQLRDRGKDWWELLRKEKGR